MISNVEDFIQSFFQIEEVRVSCDEIHDKVEFMKQIQSEILSSTTNDPSEILKLYFQFYKTNSGKQAQLDEAMAQIKTNGKKVRNRLKSLFPDF